jgi:hypothetical protein
MHLTHASQIGRAQCPHGDLKRHHTPSASLSRKSLQVITDVSNLAKGSFGLALRGHIELTWCYREGRATGLVGASDCHMTRHGTPMACATSGATGATQECEQRDGCKGPGASARVLETIVAIPNMTWFSHPSPFLRCFTLVYVSRVQYLFGGTECMVWPSLVVPRNQWHGARRILWEQVSERRAACVSYLLSLRKSNSKVSDGDHGGCGCDVPNLD